MDNIQSASSSTFTRCHDFFRLSLRFTTVASPSDSSVYASRALSSRCLPFPFRLAEEVERDEDV